MVSDSDKIIIVDPAFNYFAKKYADNQDLFFNDYAAVSDIRFSTGKLLMLV
jgi:catalase (peroxidase I)